MRMFEEKMKEIEAECDRVETLANMLCKNVKTYCGGNGMAGAEYDKNRNASKAALLNQITTLRNELLVLADSIRN